MTVAKVILLVLVVLYLCVGLVFAAMPLLFGAWKVAGLMLVAWPLIFVK